eukprot:5414926-Amphidinium_carterae.1
MQPMRVLWKANLVSQFGDLRSSTCPTERDLCREVLLVGIFFLLQGWVRIKLIRGWRCLAPSILNQNAKNT